MFTPQDFGGVGNGADDTLAVQRFLAKVGGTEGSIDKVYCVSKPLTSYKNTFLHGNGTSGFMCLPTFPAGKSLFTNAFQSFDGIEDVNIRFAHLRFWGLPATEGICNLLAYIGTGGLKFTDCKFSGCRSTMIGLRNVDTVLFEDCEILDWGSKLPVTVPGEFDGGYGIWAGDSVRGLVLNNVTFRDGQWHAILVDGIVDGRFRDVTILDGKEGGIFGGPDGLMVSGLRVKGIKQKDIAANGLEIGGKRWQISDFQISETDHAGIYLTQGRRVQISGGQIDLANEENKTNGIGAITLRSAYPDTPMEDIQIHNNILKNTEGKAWYGLTAYAWGGKPMNNVRIEGNEMGKDKDWKGQSVVIWPGAKGEDFNVIESSTKA